MQEQLTEKQVLDSFVKHILSIHNIDWSGDVSYPDKKNSKSPDIDAIASPFAIEHTSIDFLPHQRQSDQRFLKFIDGLFQEGDAHIPFRLQVNLPYHFDHCYEKKDLTRVRTAFKEFILVNACCWSDGEHKFDGVPGIPFSFTIIKDSDKTPRVRFYRIPPTDTDLCHRLSAQFNSKIDKLRQYHKRGFKTVLLVESRNGTLVDVQGRVILNAIRKVYPSGIPTELHSIWYVDTVGDLPGGIVFTDFTPSLQLEQ